METLERGAQYELAKDLNICEKNLHSPDSYLSKVSFLSSPNTEITKGGQFTGFFVHISLRGCCNSHVRTPGSMFSFAAIGHMQNI
jgi:hypothetical protein